MSNINFIYTPIEQLLDDAINATSALENKLGAFVAIEYIIHSLFLKISGMLEQKMQSIIFELGNNDIDLRYKILNGGYKGSSLLEDKNKILNQLIQQIKIYSNDNIDNKIDNIDKELWNNSIKIIKNKFCLSVFMASYLRKYQEYEEIVSTIDITKSDIYVEKKSKNNLHVIYNNYLYPTRNNLAHNISIQSNKIQKITNFSTDSYKYNNYFLFFTVFHYIDVVFIELFDKYMKSIDAML